MVKKKSDKLNSTSLYNGIRQLVYDSKVAIAVTVNKQLTMLYWNIGSMIKSEILQNKRAGYGEKVIENLSQQLTEEFGKGWTKQQLWNCLHTVAYAST